ncbi:MAG: hypothetical protein LHW61_04635 [Candidatus Cloacimonetes bacterium]|nr:hypothetical protein [Candidatus Cloacimonadota bacterium]
MKKIIFLISALGILTFTLSAGNSIFSYDGYPVQYYGTDIYSLGMGDTGTSDIFRVNNGFANPAMNNPDNRCFFSTGIIPGYNSYRSKDEQGNTKSFLDNSLDFPLFSLSFPLKLHRFGFQFNPYVSGLVSNEHTFLLEDGTEVVEKQSIDRYIYRADLIYSYRWKNNSFGVSGNYFFGHDIRDFKQEGNFGLFNTREKLSRDFKNPTFTLGYLWHNDKLALGAHYTMTTKLKGEEVRSSIHQTEEPISYTLQIPSQYSLSVTALPLSQFKVACDLHYETWEAIDENKYTDSWKAGLGFAYEPSASDEHKGMLKFPMRTGVSYRHLPFQVNEADVNELALSLGISLPLPVSVNRIDLGFQYNQRGNLEKNRLLDNSFLLMIGFTGFDIFSKPIDRTMPRDIPEKEETTLW